MEVSGKILDITNEGTAEDLNKLCELCEDDHVTATANGICRECEDFMCSTCFRHHLKAKSCRHHVLIDNDLSVSPVQKKDENVSKQRTDINIEKCKSHPNETIKYYCRKHDAVGCGDCMIPGHSACQPESINDLSKEIQQNEDFKRLLRKHGDFLSANNKSVKKVKRHRTANKTMREVALQNIQTFRTEINNHLDKAEANIMTEVEQIVCGNDELLAKIEQDCKILSSKINEDKQLLNAELYKESVLFIQTVNCKDRILGFEQEIARLQKENDIKTFRFVPNNQLQRIITSIESLGSIVETDRELPTKLDTSRQTKEESRVDLVGNKKHTESGKKNVEKAPGQAIQIAIGSRVRPIGKCFMTGYGYHRGNRGTVTAVHTKNLVDVKWDATGQKFNYCSIGEDGDVMLT